MAPGKKNHPLTPHLTRELIAEVAVRAQMNAAALVDAAMVLFDRGHYGAARSLAISAREEFGKALASISCLVGITPVDEYAKGLRSHTSKQADGVVAPTLGAALAARPDLLDTVLPLEAERGVEAAAANAFNRMRSAPEWLSAVLGPTLDLIHTRQTSARGGEDERKRQAGLYVSVEAVDDGVRLEHPQQVTAEEAAAELDEIRKMIEGLIGHHAGGLPRELWSDEEGAKRFAAFLETSFADAFHGVSVPRDAEETDGGAEQAGGPNVG